MTAGLNERQMARRCESFKKAGVGSGILIWKLNYVMHYWNLFCTVAVMVNIQVRLERLT